MAANTRLAYIAVNILMLRGCVRMELTGVWGFARSYLELTDICFVADFLAIVR